VHSKSMLATPITKLKSIMRFISVLVLVLFAFPMAGNAQSVAPKQKQLETLSKDLKQEQAKKTALNKTAKDIEKTLKEARQDLVKLTRSIRTNESELSALKVKILKQEAEHDVLLETLNEDQKSISQLIMGLERMRRMPPEAMFIKPGAPYKTAQSAMLLQKILPQVHEQAAQLRDDLETLEVKTKSLLADRDKALATSKALEDEQAKLAGLLKERERLYSKTNTNLKAAEGKIKKIAKKSKNLSQLVENIDADNKRQASKAPVRTARNIPIPKAGKPSLPISGEIIVAYKEPDSFGAPSEGLTLKGERSGIVSAPMGGVIRFAGTFKNYGKMVIIEHKGGYHSLIAGMEKMNATVNQSVLSGEPIGKLSKSAKSSHHLYFELRHKGKAVHPKKRIAGL